MNKKLYKIKQELENVLFEMEDPDYSGIIYSEKDNSPKFTVYAEVDYDRLEEICEALDEVIQRYDDGAYFEPDVPGRADCYLWNLNLEDSIKDGYYDEDDSENKKIDNEEKLFTKYLCRTDGLWHQKRTKYYEGPSGEKTYLIGMSDKFKGDINTIRTYDDEGELICKGKTVKEYFNSMDKFTGEPVGDSYSIFKTWTRDFLKDSKKVKDSDPWHESAQYQLIFEDGHKETDSVKLYIRDRYTKEELIEHFQNYYDEKIVDIKQIGWFRDSEYNEDNEEALQEYLDWEGIYGYTYDIIEVYKTKEAKIDDEWEEFDDSEEALNAYLNWEGIYGYTYDIIDILENGKDSDAYLNMVEERDGDEI